jgi:type VI secretion system FHA domain protein
MTLLKARADIKREFSSSMTILQKEENNPLKFCLSVDEALAHFFINPSPGFLSGQSAVEESSSDLCTHQMAMMSGIQNALQSTISVFDPVVLENSSNIGGFNKNSKYWEYYVSHYKKLSREAQAEFFGDDFSKAYEQQVRAMNNSR